MILISFVAKWLDRQWSIYQHASMLTDLRLTIDRLLIDSWLVFSEVSVTHQWSIDIFQLRYWITLDWYVLTNCQPITKCLSSNYWPTICWPPYQPLHRLLYWLDTTYSTLDPLVLWLEQNSHNHSNNEQEGDVCWKLLSLLVAHKNIMVYYNLMLKCFNQK